jgi:hypothetical protein
MFSGISETRKRCKIGFSTKIYITQTSNIIIPARSRGISWESLTTTPRRGTGLGRWCVSPATVQRHPTGMRRGARLVQDSSKFCPRTCPTQEHRHRRHREPLTATVHHSHRRHHRRRRRWLLMHQRHRRREALLTTTVHHSHRRREAKTTTVCRHRRRGNLLGTTGHRRHCHHRLRLHQD